MGDLGTRLGRGEVEATWADAWAGVGCVRCVRCVCVCVCVCVRVCVRACTWGGGVTERCDLSQAHSRSLELPVPGLSLLIVLL